MSSESTLEAPPDAEQASVDAAPPPRPVARTLLALIGDHPWWAAAVALVVFAAALLAYARTRPSYDAYGWLVWGWQTVHGHLDLGGAPSWKPLPFVFTVPYALIPRYELWLWMLTATAIALAGSLFAGRLAYRMLQGSMPGRRWAALVAATFSGLAVLGMEDYMHYILSVQSDPVIVTLVLAAIDRHLSGRPRWALLLGVLAALGRPEVWPFLGLYGILLWRRVPSMRWMLYAGALVVAFMWFGIPTITNGRPLIAGQLALGSPRELHSNKVFGTIGRFLELQYLPVWLASLVCVAVALWRRERLVLVLAAGCAGWVIVEIAFALHGWPALPRYVMEPAAVAAVLAGVAVGWVLIEAPRLRTGLPRWAGVPVVAVLLASLVPGAVARVRAERTDLVHEHGRTHQIQLLQTTIDVLGGVGHIRNCGKPVTDVEFASVVAWITRMDVGSVGFVPALEMKRGYPIVLFGQVPTGGWNVLRWHTKRRNIARCSGLNASFLITHSHPNGILIRHA